MGCGCCLGAIIAMFAPRIVLIVMWLCNYLAVYDTRLWPILGFLFMPCTTVGYAISMNEIGSVSDWGIVVLIICVFVDLSYAKGAMLAIKKG